MTEALSQLAQTINDIIAALGYPGIALLVCIENLVPPLPTQIVIPLAGFAVGQGELTFGGVLIACALGEVVGGLILYGLGRWVDAAVLVRYGRYAGLNAANLARAEGWFARYGVWIIVIGRLVPVPLAASAIALVAGTQRYHLPRYTILLVFVAVVWLTPFLYITVLLGENWQAILDWLG